MSPQHHCWCVNVLIPGNSATVPIATAARLLDLVNQVTKIKPTLKHEETLPQAKRPQ